jgi:hypothetical protein
MVGRSNGVEIIKVLTTLFVYRKPIATKVQHAIKITQRIPTSWMHTNTSHPFTPNGDGRSWQCTPKHLVFQRGIEQP